MQRIQMIHLNDITVSFNLSSNSMEKIYTPTDDA
jgi:hypothetical protein